MTGMPDPGASSDDLEIGRDLAVVARDCLAGGGSPDQAVQAVLEQTRSPIAAIKAMRDALPGLSLREVKPLVHRNLPLATRKAAEESWNHMERTAAAVARQSDGDRRRSADEIREHFKARIMAAVLRPGAWGGEIALRLFLDDLAWIDRRDTPRGQARDALAAMGAFSPTGVTGVFTHMFGGIPADHLSAVGMVYADLAWTCSSG